MNIGEKINQLRKMKKMTLMELANASGVAQATLSRIENGRMTGTVESHTRIAETLGVTLPELYGGVDIVEKEIIFQKSGDVSNTFLHGEGGVATLLTKNALRKKMMPVLFEIETGSLAPQEENSPDTEKFIYCLKGAIEVAIGEKVFPLAVGDSLYFNASLKHTISNRGEELSRCLIISAPPAL